MAGAVVVPRGTREVLTILAACVVSALVAFAVASRQDSSSNGSYSTSALPATLSRATTSLETKTVRPGVSLQGQVVSVDGEFRLAAAVSPQAKLYDLIETPPVQVKGLIEGGPAGFDCAWIGAVYLDGEVTLQCRIPADVLVVEGLVGTFLAQTEPPTDTSVLPLTAVIGRISEGLVIVSDDSHVLSVRTVTLGKSDTYNVEVTSGLQPGEEVLLYPTQLDLDALQ